MSHYNTFLLLANFAAAVINFTIWYYTGTKMNLICGFVSIGFTILMGRVCHLW